MEQGYRQNWGCRDGRESRPNAARRWRVVTLAYVSSVAFDYICKIDWNDWFWWIWLWIISRYEFHLGICSPGRWEMGILLGKRKQDDWTRSYHRFRTCRYYRQELFFLKFSAWRKWKKKPFCNRGCNVWDIWQEQGDVICHHSTGKPHIFLWIKMSEICNYWSLSNNTERWIEQDEVKLFSTKRAHAAQETFIYVFAPEYWVGIGMVTTAIILFTFCNRNPLSWDK